MAFEHKSFDEKLGEKFGFVLGYLLFTTVLFFIFVLLNKVPDSWQYLHFMAVTFVIALSGYIIKRLLR